MFCKNCGKEVLEKLDYCHHCGKSYKKSNNIEANKEFLKMMIFPFIIFIFILFAVYSCSNSTNNIPNTESDAIIASKNIIKDSLKNPSSAKFRDISCIKISDGMFEIKGIVNATNSFGGNLDKNFVLKIQYNGNGWNILSINID